MALCLRDLCGPAAGDLDSTADRSAGAAHQPVCERRRQSVARGGRTQRRKPEGRDRAVAVARAGILFLESAHPLRHAGAARQRWRGQRSVGAGLHQRRGPAPFPVAAHPRWREGLRHHLRRGHWFTVRSAERRSSDYRNLAQRLSGAVLRRHRQGSEFRDHRESRRLDRRRFRHRSHDRKRPRRWRLDRYQEAVTLAAARPLIAILAEACGTMDSGMVVFCGRVVLPDRVLEDGAVVCRDGRIAAVTRRVPAGAKVVRGAWIVPGFVDIHVHGGEGADYMDGTAEAVRIANRAHLRRGTTTIFPTTTTGSPEQVRRMIDACLEVRRAWTAADGARIGGVHLYGPYFAEKKVGCHSVTGRRDPRASEYDEYFRLRIVKIATCAAELPGAAEVYRAARRRRCLVTCGHSNATWSDMERS